MNCPHCGKPIETQQHRAAQSRWSLMSKSERSAEMSRIRRKGIKKPKRTARRSKPARLTDSRQENDFMSKINSKTKKCVRRSPARAAVRVQPLVTPLSHAGIIAELEGEVRTYQESYREIDGWVRDEGARKTIVALKLAIEAVKRCNGQ